MGAQGVDFEAAEQVLAIELFGQGQQQGQGDDAAQQGKLEHRGIGFKEFDEDVRDQGHGVADDQQKDRAVDGFA
ncbi:hypothetical protein GCM10011362_12950 [Marinobacter halophilus]|nr:hypothetical protein GCM10011362_12950 [Marinobacter halophilus]